MTFSEAIEQELAVIALLESAITDKNESKIRKALAELKAKNGVLRDVAMALLETSLEIQAAQMSCSKENIALKAALDDRSKYALTEVFPGKFCYSAKVDEKSGEPAHHICQLCFDAGVKAVLQFSPKSDFLDKIS